MIIVEIDCKLIEIPYIPLQHVECWFHNQNHLNKLQLKNYCQHNDFNLIRTDFSDESNQYKNRFCETILLLPEKLHCWGYENDLNNLTKNNDCNLLYEPVCNGLSNSWASDSDEQWQTFFNTADFGYIRQQRNELRMYCRPKNDEPQSSSLECTKYTRFCRSKNIYINFQKLSHLPEPIRYREDVLDYGDIGGYDCDYSRNDLKLEGAHKSPLMSWFAEISQFKNISSKNQKKCDITINKPAYIMKLDATINMYHHFCDFINLYLSFHVNNSFNRDNQILIWDTYPYRSNFGIIWQTFTTNKLMNLSMLKGRTICFKEVIFPLLPRMIYGLYYNMPLIPGCFASGIFRAFNRHVLFHLNLPDTESIISENKNVINITFIERSTKYRRIINQQQLIDSLKSHVQNLPIVVNIRSVDFNHRMPFLEQMRISSSSDILIGIHGAGLTHTLFQPDYGILFELYNCDDHDCYKDLARLRGTHYMTWDDQNKFEIIMDENDQLQNNDRKSLGKAHEKFVNYRFDSTEFIRKMDEAINLIQKRKNSFINNNLKEKFKTIDDDKMLEKNEL